MGHRQGELELWLPHVVTKHGTPGRPHTRHEPLLNRGKPYPHPSTTAGMRAWREAWFFAGSVKVPEPIVLEVYVRSQRPKTHYTAAASNYNLSAVGKRYRYPPGFDCSNVLKLVEDALKGYCFGDDADVVAAHVAKRWVSQSEKAGTFLTIRHAQSLD